MHLIEGLLGGLLIAMITTPVGVSGAVLLLPYQLTVLGTPSPTVTPTNLLYNVIAVPGALLRHRQQGSLRSPLTRPLLLGTLPAVVIGAGVRVTLLPDAGTFQILVASLLILLGGLLVAKAVRVAPASTTRHPPSPRVVTGIAAVAGLIGGIYGIGGGSLVAPVLVALGAAPLLVAPAALTATFLTSCVGVATYAALSLLGQPAAAPDWTLAIACGVGGLLGGYIGAALHSHVPQRSLVALLGGVSVAIGAAYVWEVLA